MLTFGFHVTGVLTLVYHIKVQYIHTISL